MVRFMCQCYRDTQLDTQFIEYSGLLYVVLMRLKSHLNFDFSGFGV